MTLTLGLTPNTNGRYPWSIVGNGWAASGTGKSVDDAIALARTEAAEREKAA